MWIDDDGVAHTVALPDPTHVMADDFRTSLDLLAEQDRPRLRDLLEVAEIRLLDADLSRLKRPAHDAEFREAAAPGDLLRGRMATPEDLTRLIGQVELRWRMDAILALFDYVD